MAERVRFLNTRFDSMTPDEAIKNVLNNALSRTGGRVFFANAHTMVTARRVPALAAALESSNLLLADGSGVRWGSRWLKTPLEHNLNGTDLVPRLCEAGSSSGLSVYLLGGRPGVAEEAARRLQAAYPGLQIAGCEHGYHPASETPRLLNQIAAARPHVLLVAMGVPLQELWIEQHYPQLPGVTCLGVGGLFDFLAGRVARAPKVVRQVGMEWGWRLAMEPGRMWKRYLVGNLTFVGLVASHARRQSATAPLSPARSSAGLRDYQYNYTVVPERVTSFDYAALNSSSGDA